MDSNRPCGCKGCRTCLICEKTHGIRAKPVELNKNETAFVYCPFCSKAWPGWDLNEYKKHPNHIGEPIDYPGIYIDLNFLNKDDEAILLSGIDGMAWDLSQSGRRKQNFGPKCNFKKNKLKVGDFRGFPEFSKFVQRRFENVPILEHFQTIEQCSLEYDPRRGASIDPHIDDCWIWGERVVTVNLLADSVLTMTYNDKPERYNLHWVGKYPAVLDKCGALNTAGDAFKVTPLKEGGRFPIVRIPMPKRSLLVIFGAARYNWEHQVFREDIVERRICLAYREFTPNYINAKENYNEVAEILNRAKYFFA